MDSETNKSNRFCFTVPQRHSGVSPPQRGSKIIDSKKHLRDANLSIPLDKFGTVTHILNPIKEPLTVLPANIRWPFLLLHLPSSISAQA